MKISVQELGIRAQQVISHDQDASVSGVTSRGSFISTRKGSVIFLSGEVYRGPLTLNLKDKEGIFQRISPGNAIYIRDRNLYFSTCNLFISTSQAEEWKPDNPSPHILSPSERQSQLMEVRNQLFAKSDFSPNKKLENLEKSIHSDDERKIVSALEPFLGCGTGLTPAGDDLIVGLLLTLNRWGWLLNPGLRPREINLPIVQAARQRTTALSSNLIECAAQTQADERLILALDSLMTGEPDQATCIACLRDYGNSSGRDSLLGMVSFLNNTKTDHLE